MTPAEATTALKALAGDTPDEALKAVKAAQTKWRTLTINDERQHGLVRAILGKYKASQWPPIVLKVKVMRIGNAFQGGLKMRGLSALQEHGGHTQKHWIKNAWGKGKTVVHPGGPVAQFASADKTLPEAEAFLARRLDQNIAKAIAKAKLAG